MIVIGYGNPGRLDDGLGPAFADRVGRLGLDQVTTDADYQLSVEEAARIAEYDIVLFADASVDAPPPYTCEPLAPQEGASFTSHHVSPGQVLYLAQSLFQADTAAFLLAIRGYRFNEFGEGLSDQAAGNLDAATAYFQKVAESRWQF